jgi:hypothetical protein
MILACCPVLPRSLPMTAYRVLTLEARRPGLELGPRESGDDGALIGRDPRDLTSDELRALGHGEAGRVAAAARMARHARRPDNGKGKIEPGDAGVVE